MESLLTLINEREKRAPSGAWMGLYQCQCGNQKIIRNSDVCQGKTKSCGCYRKKQLSASKIKDLTGQKFGRWTVIERVLDKTGHGAIWKCRCECGTIKEIQAGNLVDGKSKSCGCLRRDLYTEDISGQTFGNLTAISLNLEETKKQNKTIWNCLCSCGNQCLMSAHRLKQDSAIVSCGCKTAKSSCGESIIEDILNELNISFETQKTFSDLKGKKNLLRFDFYLPEQNICIEFQGAQHYSPIDYFGGEERYQTQLLYDQKKRDYCKKNKIKLIEISYLQISEIDKDFILNLLK